jgi:hypothetical protein
MFHKSISRYGLATHLALAAALPAALAQFVSAATLCISMLWVALAAWIWMFFEPSVFAGETVSRARGRLASGMLRDPFAWFLLVAGAFAFIRWLNSGVKLFYDAEKAIWSVKEPAMSIMPASTGDSGFLPFVTVIVAATVIIGVRHAIGKNARIWFGVMTGAFTAIGGLASVICVALDAGALKEAALAGFGSPFFYGSAFAFTLPFAIACGIEAEERKITKTRLPFAFAVAGNSVAAFVFLPILLSSVYLLISVVVAVVSLALCKKREGAAACARAASMLAFGIVGAASSVLVPSYKGIVQEKFAAVDIEKAFPLALQDRNEALQRVSLDMWKDFQWGGTGVGAFKLHAPFYVSKEDWAVLPPRPEQSFNSYFSILSERGIVGSLFWVVGIGFLVFFWVSRLVESLKWHQTQEEGKAWIFCVPSVVWAGVAVLAASLADAWFSLGFVLTALPVSTASAMVLAAASFPKMKRSRSNGELKG